MGKNISSIKGMRDVELLFQIYDDNFYLVHDCNQSIPSFIKRYNFDAIIMTSTFMDHVKRYEIGSEWHRQYSFLTDTKALKVVFSQDDYWLSAVRDQFYTDNKIDIVLPSVQSESWNDLFPIYSKAGNLIQGYTTYLTPHIRSLEKFSKPWDDRKIDFFYRASGLPTFPNSLGRVKAEIGDTFKKVSQNHSRKYKYDIKTIDYNSKEALTGDKWYEYLGNSKAIIGSNSGSSVKIETHSIAKKIHEFNKSNYDIYSSLSLIPSSDRNKNYTGISPRNLEAAFTRTLQILVPGEYGNILTPYKDYIPFEQNGSNMREVLDIFSDKEKCSEIIENCYNTFSGFKDIQYEELIDMIHRMIRINKTDSEKSELDFKKLQLKTNVFLPLIKINDFTHKILKKIHFK
tara:strand:- start:26101 stop:27303 length:1203 start_codon:yes stop_codon:yes gene_type:complete